MKEEILKLIERVEEQTGQSLPKFSAYEQDAPLAVMIIGQPQQNLFGIIGKLLQQPNRLNTSLLHGYLCELTYGDEQKIFIQSETGEYAETTEDTLYEALMSFGNTGEPLHCAMQVNHPLLNGMMIRLVASDDDFDDVDVNEVVTSCDVGFMALNAAAVLSMCERKILRKGLMTELGEQLGIALVNSTTVDPDGMKDVEETLDIFLKGSHVVYDMDMKPEVFSAVLGALKGKKEDLHAKRDERAYRKCVEAALCELRKTIALIEEDEDRLGDAIALLKEKTKELPKRQEAASRRCRMKYLSGMKVEYSDILSKQHQMIRDALAEEIERGEDIQRMSEIIPGYIKNEWERAAEQVFGQLKGSSKEMETYLADYVTQDVYEFIGENGNGDTADYIMRLTNLYPEQCFRGEAGSITIDVAKDYSKLKRGGAIAAGVALALVGHPLIGAGLAVYGATKAGKQSAELTKATNKEALKQATDNLCAENYASATEWLDGVFVQMNESINAGIQESYNRLMDGMLAVIRARQTDEETKQQSLVELKDLEAELSSAV